MTTRSKSRVRERARTLLDVGEALLALEAIDAELAEVVDMRYFGGYSEAEIAEMQGVTERTVRRRWEKTHARLYLALDRKSSNGAPS